MAKDVFFFGDGKAEGDPKRRDLLGGKGAGLAEMTGLGLPVPPGFTLSTEICREYQRTKALPRDLPDAIDEAMKRVEKLTGMIFGDRANPLLVSVRSGARASMPGMMDTLLNLGLNDVTVQGLATRTQNPRFAFDAYRRFITMYADVALELEKEPFHAALEEARGRVARKKGIDPRKMAPEELMLRVPDSELTIEELEPLTTELKRLVEHGSGKPFPADPKAQLFGAIEAVFRSWDNQRAIFYRRMHDIPDEWGTAANVQAMVFGNLGDTSATGVAFSRDPTTGEKRLYGEWLPNAQGEDVVAGIRTPLPVLPITDAQEKDSLRHRMPAAFAELVKISDRLEAHFRDMQDLEFTIQDGKLYMLQCRSAKRTGPAAVRSAVEMVRENLITKKEALLRVNANALDQLLHPTLDPKAPKKLLTRGFAASPGAVSGHIVFSADEAEKWTEQGRPVILVRTETSPEDIHGMKAARGILTARGGQTSHASVVARGMGRACVTGASSISIDFAQQVMAVHAAHSHGKTPDALILKKGEIITLDGATGCVYQGAVPTVAASMTGEFAELLSWADAARKLGVRANADTPFDARTARSFGAEGIGLCRTEHMFFDEARIAAVREMILSDDIEQRKRALAKLLPVQREDFIGIFREMAGLPVTIRLLDPPLHEFLPTDHGQFEQLGKAMGVPVQQLELRAKGLHEVNPMLGHRGCRLAVTFPEIYEMQVRAILEAALQVAQEGKKVLPEIMIPLAITRAELAQMRQLVDRVAADVLGKDGKLPFSFGTMIELPRAALLADELAESAEFFSFGTNDLTQATLGISRDDAAKFMPSYLQSGLLANDPFASLDQAGVGQLVRLAVERGKKTRKDVKLGVCGEHGGDPASIEFFHDSGLAYVSCSPFRVPVARLAAAQAALRESA